MKSDKGVGHSYPIYIVRIQRNLKILKYSNSILPTTSRYLNGTVERTIQTMKKMLLANMEDGNILSESVNRALKVMRLTKHTGLKKRHLNYTTVENRIRN